MNRPVVEMLIAAVAVVAASMYAVPAVRCNRMEARLEKRTLRVFGGTDPSAIAPAVRRNLDDVVECLAVDPLNVNLYMIAGANDRAIKRFDDAAVAYRRALTYDRRPELYLNLGQTLIAANRREEGMKMLLTAARFYADEGRINYVMSDIPEVEEVKQRLRAEGR